MAMIALGIDPSLTCGAAALDFHHGEVDVVSTWSHRVPPRRRDDSYQAEAEVMHKFTEWFLDQDVPTFVALEVPSTDNAQMGYKRKDGSRGSRAITSASQWRLIGAFCDRFHPKLVRVTPLEAKRAVGVHGRSGCKPVAEVQRLTGVDLGHHPKYQSEAIADAIAVCLAGWQIHRALQTLARG